MNLTLTKAKPEQFTLIFSTLEESAKWLTSKNIEQWNLNWLETLRIEIKKSISLGQYYLVKSQEKLVGVVEIKETPEEIWNYDPTPSLYVHKLSVVRSFAGKGIGQKILEQVMVMAKEKKISVIRLDCVAHNIDLRNYYGANGFIYQGMQHIETYNEHQLALFAKEVQL